MSTVKRENDRDAQKLKEERQLIPQRLTTFLIGNSILVLGFIEITVSSTFLSQVLSIIGLLFTTFALIQFWPLPARLDKLEGVQDKGLKRFGRRIRQGRSVGIGSAILFDIFWLCAVAWSFNLLTLD